MATPLELAAFNALRAACDSPLGIIIRVEVPPGITSVTPALRAKQVLYRFRDELKDVEFKSIQIRFSPDNPDTELWLVKTDVVNPSDSLEDLSAPTQALTLNLDE